MAVFTKTFVQDLKGCMDVHITEGLVFSADNDSNVVSVEIYNGGEAATLTGSVVVYVIRADGNTVVFGGTLSGNTASAVLPQSCFVIPGPIAVMLQIVSGDVRTTVLKAVFTAVASSTGAIIDPGHVIPDISDIIAMLDQMEAATEAANAAAIAAGNVNATQSKSGNVITITITDRTGTSTSTTLVDTGSMIAPLEASSTASTAYPAGSYFVLNNTLYRATVDIASGATITPGTNCATATISAGVEEAVDTANEAVTEVQANQITQTASGNPIEITDGADDIPVRQLLANIIPAQAGEGDPSPTNIRAISGHVFVEVTINGTTYGQFFPSAVGTVYAGTLDVLTGMLTVGYAIETLTSEKAVSYGAPRFYFALGSVPRKGGGVTMFCSHYKPVYPRSTAEFDNDDYAITLSNSTLSAANGRCFLRDSRYTTVADLKSYWDAQNLAGTPVQVVYPIATPQTYQLTPQVVKTLLGANSFSVDCGTLDLTYVADLQTYVDDEIAAATAVRDVQVNGTSVVQDGVANIHLPQTVTVSGTTPTIVGAADTRYICGEVATLDITLPASGIVDVVFESGSTATVLTITPPTGQTVRWANGFDPTALDANTTYEINIADGLGVAASWT